MPKMYWKILHHFHVKRQSLIFPFFKIIFIHSSFNRKVKRNSFFLFTQATIFLQAVRSQVLLRGTRACKAGEQISVHRTSVMMLIDATPNRVQQSCLLCDTAAVLTASQNARANTEPDHSA